MVQNFSTIFGKETIQLFYPANSRERRTKAIPRRNNDVAHRPIRPRNSQQQYPQIAEHLTRDGLSVRFPCNSSRWIRDSRYWWGTRAHAAPEVVHRTIGASDFGVHYSRSQCTLPVHCRRRQERKREPWWKWYTVNLLEVYNRRETARLWYSFFWNCRVNKQLHEALCKVGGRKSVEKREYFWQAAVVLWRRGNTPQPFFCYTHSLKRKFKLGTFILPHTNNMKAHPFIPIRSFKAGRNV